MVRICGIFVLPRCLFRVAFFPLHCGRKNVTMNCGSICVLQVDLGFRYHYSSIILGNRWTMVLPRSDFEDMRPNFGKELKPSKLWLACGKHSLGRSNRPHPTRQTYRQTDWMQNQKRDRPTGTCQMKIFFNFVNLQTSARWPMEYCRFQTKVHRSVTKLCTLQNGKLLKLCLSRPRKMFVSTVAQHCAQPEHHTASLQVFSWTTKSYFSGAYSIPEALSHTQPYWLDSQQTGRLIDSEGLWQAVRHVKETPPWTSIVLGNRTLSNKVPVLMSSAILTLTQITFIAL